MSEARTEILSRVGAALADDPVPPPVPRDYRRGRTEGDDPVGDLVSRLAGYGAVAVRADSSDMIAVARELLAVRGAHRLAAPSSPRIAWVAAAGAELVPDDPPLTTRQLIELDGVVTACAVAVGDTGTIVLDAGPGQGRRELTLLPDYHLCVVRAAQVVATVAEAVSRLDPRRPQTWISGPSATVDIELSRVVGVHGPRTLHVIVLG